MTRRLYLFCKICQFLTRISPGSFLQLFLVF